MSPPPGRRAGGAARPPPGRGATPLRRSPTPPAPLPPRRHEQELLSGGYIAGSEGPTAASAGSLRAMSLIWKGEGTFAEWLPELGAAGAGRAAAERAGGSSAPVPAPASPDAAGGGGWFRRRGPAAAAAAAAAGAAGAAAAASPAREPVDAPAGRAPSPGPGAAGGAPPRAGARRSQVDGPILRASPGTDAAEEMLPAGAGGDFISNPATSFWQRIQGPGGAPAGELAAPGRRGAREDAGPRADEAPLAGAGAGAGAPLTSDVINSWATSLGKVLGIPPTTAGASNRGSRQLDPIAVIAASPHHPALSPAGAEEWGAVAGRLAGALGQCRAASEARNPPVRIDLLVADAWGAKRPGPSPVLRLPQELRTWVIRQLVRFSRGRLTPWQVTMLGFHGLSDDSAGLLFELMARVLAAQAGTVPITCATALRLKAFADEGFLLPTEDAEAAPVLYYDDGAEEAPRPKRKRGRKPLKKRQEEEEAAAAAAAAAAATAAAEAAAGLAGAAEAAAAGDAAADAEGGGVDRVLARGDVWRLVPEARDRNHAARIVRRWLRLTRIQASMGLLSGRQVQLLTALGVWPLVGGVQAAQAQEAQAAWHARRQARQLGAGQALAREQAAAAAAAGDAGATPVQSSSLNGGTSQGAAGAVVPPGAPAGAGAGAAAPDAPNADARELARRMDARAMRALCASSELYGPWDVRLAMLIDQIVEHPRRKALAAGGGAEAAGREDGPAGDAFGALPADLRDWVAEQRGGADGSVGPRRKAQLLALGVAAPPPRSAPAERVPAGGAVGQTRLQAP